MIIFISLHKKLCKENDVHIVDGTKIQETNIDETKLDNLIQST